MEWYWIAYAISNGDGWVGTGAVDVEMSGSPSSMQEINQLAVRLTDSLRGRPLGGLKDDQHVSVLSWSRMADR